MKFGADFDALIAQFSSETDHPLALAVSGGSDSLSLLTLANDWSNTTGRRLHVYTVDHGLRADAKGEARMVADLCAQLEQRHEILTWSAPKQTQQAAREARYELICNAMQRAKSDILLTGHTLDDVMETALIRRRRGVRDATMVGPALAAPAPVWPTGRGLTLVRPLIQHSRQSLREMLRKKQWAWVDDPSNESLAFERVRVRKFLKRHKRLEAITRAAVQRHMKARSDHDNALSEAISRVIVRDDGVIDTASAPITPRLLALLARCASGGTRDARAGMIQELFRTLSKPGARQTLGGAWFQKTRHGFLVGRDPGADPSLSSDLVFDGRFEADDTAVLPDLSDHSFLVRQSAPAGENWREIISERLSHIAQCFGTPDLNPVKT